ncbi:hypothetical protein ACOMHN_061506 [Nucella lapillus]
MPSSVSRVLRFHTTIARQAQVLTSGAKFRCVVEAEVTVSGDMVTLFQWTVSGDTVTLFQWTVSGDMVTLFQ